MTNKHINTQGEDITSLSRVIDMIDMNKHDQIKNIRSSFILTCTYMQLARPIAQVVGVAILQHTPWRVGYSRE